MSRSFAPSTHRIGVLMSPAGRYLECEDCLLRFDFPVGAPYEVIATRFRSYQCPSPTRQVVDISTARQETQRYLVMLRYQGRVPVMASCAKCERKFFVPNTFSRDAVAGEDYLRQRFDMHRCEEQEM